MVHLHVLCLVLLSDNRDFHVIEVAEVTSSTWKIQLWHYDRKKIAFASNRRQMGTQKAFCSKTFVVKLGYLMAFCSSLK